MENKLFVRLDADNIGDRIELALINGNPIEAQRIHNEVQVAMQSLVNIIKVIPGTEILLVGADDILFSGQPTVLSRDILENIRTEFYKITMFTLSIGVGPTISSALQNLTRAKLSGKDRIVSENV